jgi:hypothetical protein
VLLRTRNVSEKKIAEKIKMHISCSVTFLFENRAAYEIMWQNIVDRGRPQVTIWRKCIVCWTPKATNRHSEYVILTASPQQQWSHERATMLRYTFIAGLGVQYINCTTLLHRGSEKE